MENDLIFLLDLGSVELVRSRDGEYAALLYDWEPPGLYNWERSQEDKDSPYPSPSAPYGQGGTPAVAVRELAERVRQMMKGDE